MDQQRLVQLVLVLDPQEQLQLVLQAVNYDVQSAPSEPIHPRLRAVERLKGGGL